MIPESEIERIVGGKAETKEIRAVIYARVSSSDQKRELERQIQYLTQYCSTKGYRVVDTLSDVASSIEANRRGLLKLFDYVINKQVDAIIVTYKDRLTRFCFEHLEYFFKEHGVSIVYVNPKNTSRLCPIHNAPITYSNGSRVGKCNKGKELWHRDVVACWNLFF